LNGYLKRKGFVAGLGKDGWMEWRGRFERAGCRKLKGSEAAKTLRE